MVKKDTVVHTFAKEENMFEAMNCGSHFKDAFPTLFLPIAVPTKLLVEETAGQRDECQAVLCCLKEFLERTDLGEPSLCKVAETFVNLHLGKGLSDAHTVRRSLEATPVSGYWGCHVREQNAAVLIYRKSKTKTLFMAWQVQPKNEHVTGNVRICQTYPQSLTEIRWERLLASVAVICDLATREQPRALPVTHKAGEAFPETREVNSPVYVLDILVAAFGGDRVSEKKGTTLNKKMRDEVRYESSERPWRREPVWAVIKSILHLVCIRETGSKTGYKVLIQRFLAFCLERVCPESNRIDSLSLNEIELSSLTEASRKLARRLEKLRQVPPVCDESQLVMVSDETTQAAQKAMDIVDSDWKKRCDEPSPANFDLQLEQMMGDIKQSLPRSRKTLKRLHHIATKKKGDITDGANYDKNVPVGLPKGFPRCRNWSPYDVDDINIQIDLLHKSLSDQFAVSPQHFIGTLNDVSEGIMNAFEELQRSDRASVDNADRLAAGLLRLEKTVIETGLGLSKDDKIRPFQHDVRAKSQVILIAITVCLMIDRVACLEYPMLSEHKLGFCHSGMFESLFLPSVRYKKHLHLVESYVGRRQAASGSPTLETDPRANSFSVRFVESFNQMEQARKEILRRCKQKQEEKRQEKNLKQRQHDDIMQRISNMQCECCYYRHSCDRCRLQKDAENVELCFHEKYLPDGLTEQRAVVFELLMPDAIACQRDSLVIFADMVCNEQWWEKSPFAGFWASEHVLFEWRLNTCTDEAKLGSSSKKVTHSHYGRPSHVSRHHSFVTSNGYETILMGPEGPAIGVSCWKWDISAHTQMKVPEGPYCNLEAYFNSFSHCENEIIALKSEASEELTILEFEEVGAVRAGQALQLERMLAGLRQQAFSLDREEIVSLFQCVLWQVGPRSKQGDWVRTCADCMRESPSLTRDMCLVLEKIISECRTNWGSSHTLLNVLHIARHFFDHLFALDLREVDAFVKLLRSCRAVALEWILILLQKLNECKSDGDRQNLRLKIVDIACMGVLSFLDHDSVLATPEDLRDWLLLRVHFYDNVAPDETSKPSWRRPQLLHCMEIAEILAPRLLRIIGDSSAGLTLFLNEHWTLANGSRRVKKWAGYDDETCWSWYSCRLRLPHRICTIQIDVVGGSFLVDGHPCARLPKDLCAERVFRRLFGDSIFMVQPIGNGGHRTMLPVRGFTYEFYPSGFNPSIPGFDSNPVIVKQRMDVKDHNMLTSERSVLVPDSLLDGDIPEVLTTNYTHWFVLSGSQDSELVSRMYFCPVKYSHPRMQFDFADDDYVLDFRTGRLVDQRSKKTQKTCFLDFHGACFRELHMCVFSRLSPTKFVHVYTDFSKVTVELPKLEQIHFDYDGSMITAREYRGRRVSSSQNLGVFIGLKNGLFLEDSRRSGTMNRIFLCPHGEIKQHENATLIETTKLSDPPLFKYELREELRDLKAIGRGRLPWQFLALLHAQTSGLKADPFTGCTGLQRSCHILRLGHCTGNLITSFDENALRNALKPEIDLLGKIARLSTKRSDYHHMEQVKMKRGIPPLCAHNGLAFLVRDRINDLMEALKQIGMQSVFDGTFKQVCETSLGGRVDLLSERAYLQRQQLYPKDSNLTEAEESRLHAEQEVLSIGDDQMSTFEAMEIHKVGYATQNERFALYSESSLTDLLCSLESLKGCRSFCSVPLSENTGLLFETLFSESAGSPSRIQFHDTWLELYRIARQEAWRSRQQRIQYCNLLTWAASEHPGYSDYLVQLVLVARNPKKFPQPPRHRKYEKTHEIDYVAAHVNSLIDAHMATFSESRPYKSSSEEVYQYNQKLSAWKYRQEEHNRVNQRSKKALTCCILASFRKWGDVAETDLRFQNVRNEASLAKQLQRLFDRWRHSLELRNFVAEVQSAFEFEMRFEVAPTRSFNKPVRTKATKWSVEPAFVLLSGGQLQVALGTDDLIEILVAARTGAMEQAYVFNYEVNRAASESQLALSLPNHGGMDDGAEGELYNKLKHELEASVKLALKSPENDISFLCDPSVLDNIEAELNSYLTRAKEKMEKTWRLVEFIKSDDTELLSAVGLRDATTPVGVLSALFQPSNLDGLKQVLGYTWNLRSSTRIGTVIVSAFATFTKHVQRARRCLRLMRQGNAAHHRLAHEVLSPGCVGWNPGDFPEFLAFELDNDMSVREVQARVAKEMLNCDHGNRLLQMNMGHGKSAVIMPLVLCCAGDGHSISRGTVLSSLYATNARDWQAKVGGILGRRLFPMLCRRDVSVDPILALKTIEKCRRGRDIILTVPEHRLSLENKALELCSTSSFSGNVEEGEKLLRVVDTLSQDARDFLDESDEILSPKYQLVYTLGAPEDLDGGEIRWSLHAAVLQSLSINARKLHKEYGSETVQIVRLKPAPYEFNAIRLLDSRERDDAYEMLCDLIIKDILNNAVPRDRPFNLRMKVDVYKVWEKFVRGANLPDHEFEMLKESDKILQSAFCLRGFLAHRTLCAVLKKRFRVQYGAHPTRKNHHMAVPFIAKDVASDRTDFANPDVAVSLTFATYYQQGLSESQLLDVFARLSRMNDAASIYRRWTSGMYDVSDIADYGCVNLEDRTLFRSRLYPAFRMHLGVVDFWLLKIILPVQAKQFPQQITATAFDLCKNVVMVPQWTAVTTGFSGTADLSRVLPATVHQGVLEELEMTNGLQVLSICRPENNEYYGLKTQNLASGKETSTDQLLSLLRSDGQDGSVVLDAGALVLHMSNEEFARAWLKQKHINFDACAFFQNDSMVFVKKYDEARVWPFAGSPYEDDMTRCLLYLDDAHTRGSDYLLPLETKAIMTLGTNMTKDKFAQACMRMRQLGMGQRLAFVAPPDVDVELRKFQDCGNEELSQVTKILSWTLRNTATRICDLVPYSLGQAASAMRKANAFKDHYYTELKLLADTTNRVSGLACQNPHQGTEMGSQRLEMLAADCVEDEELSLEKMYSGTRTPETLESIAVSRLKPLPESLVKELIMERVRNTAPGAVRYCSLLDEEQERELEHELDEERQVERPPPADPAKSKMSPELAKFLKTKRITYGQYSAAARRKRAKTASVSAASPVQSTASAEMERLVDIGFKRFSGYFLNTSYRFDHEEVQECRVLVTEDLIRTIKGSNDQKFYLKRFRWFLPITCSDGVGIVILISNFEAEKVISKYGEDIHSSHGRRPFQSFVPFTRRGQLAIQNSFERVFEIPMELHVFAGSINAPEHIIERMKAFLGLHHLQASEWSRLYRDGEIERDGFVHPSKRIDSFSFCPFHNSPIPFVLDFLCSSRHLSGDIRTSVLGELLEAADDVDGSEQS